MTDENSNETFKDYLKEILTLHPAPCTILLYVDEKGICHIRGAASSNDDLHFVLEHNTKMKEVPADYCG